MALDQDGWGHRPPFLVVKKENNKTTSPGFHHASIPAFPVHMVEAGLPLSTLLSVVSGKIRGEESKHIIYTLDWRGR